MEYCNLNGTELKISRIGLGCSALAGGHGEKQEKSDSQAAIHTALDKGITFFDTAESYGSGQSEIILGETLPKNRDNLVIASKPASKHRSKEELIKACEESLKRLKSEHIDLYQQHWYWGDEYLDDMFEAFEELKFQGKVRHYGVCNFGKQQLKKSLEKSYRISSNQLPYNLIFRAIEYQVLPFCREKKIPVLCYAPMMQGLLTGKFKSADDCPENRQCSRHFSSQKRKLAKHGENGAEELTFKTIDVLKEKARYYYVPMADICNAWILKQPRISSIIIGGRNQEQVDSNVCALELPLWPSIYDELTQLSEPLKEHMGDNADLWQSLSESRIW